MIKKIALLIILISCSFVFVQAQQNKKLIQFSGVVVNGDSLQPIPFVNIMIKNSYHGTVSDYYGYFSFVAQESDVIEFSALGYKKSTFTIPDSLEESRYSLIQMLNGDTILLSTAIIYPWPTKEQFKQAFINLELPNDDMARAQRNLEREAMRQRGESMSMDGAMNQKYYLQQRNSRLYYAGQLPPNNLLNPIAWAKFIQAWKNGDFKRK
ncbi:MAG: carboxypeptidase-like regulatory domain-containing protein [Bacteroidetes bacterium]|nr:carboxypeptidase-like regulatory domain-containing protein [Bacteroidota bacterium]MBK9673159.1 carboxypeptidase-like regulatory domain-containing protein [Bacteroidota bacterium]MBK9798715.1 carboxypeptidase-like regulatory domain-containing protein [Bacteroidota bacterium]MBP6413776.1 carboxypeptidase-like regulatory domain-containing protein [Bacteroidia bacterium]